MMKDFVICSAKYDVRLRNLAGLDGHCIWHTWLRRKIHTELRWRILKEKHGFKDLGVIVCVYI